MMRLLARRDQRDPRRGGRALNGALLEAGLVDEILAYVAPSLLGDPARGIAQFAALQGLAERACALRSSRSTASATTCASGRVGALPT